MKNGAASDGTKPIYLLVSDLDDTLLGDDAALARFRDFCDEHPELLGVAYASGRSSSSIASSIAKTRLPAPLAIIGGVGSEIRLFPADEPLQAWWDEIGRDWSARAVRRVLEGVPDLELQPESEQSPYKVSYHYPEATEEDLQDLATRLDRAGLAYEFIYSSKRDLDVLPRGVDKGRAALRLAAELGYPPARVLAAGNSANDAALMKQGFGGIVVGNAHADLKALGEWDRVYVATKHYADGVLEGVRHWIEELPS